MKCFRKITNKSEVHKSEVLADCGADKKNAYDEDVFFFFESGMPLQPIGSGMRAP